MQISDKNVEHIHEQYIKRCYELAVSAGKKGFDTFGAVLVSDGEIIAEAEKKAQSIIADAEEKSQEIIKNAKAETSKMEKASEEAIVQAGRNMLLSFKDSLLSELNGLVQAETEKATTKDVLAKLIPETVKAWSKNTQVDELSVLLSEKDLASLQAAFTNELKAEIEKGLEIKPDKTLSSGFRIGVKNGAAYYDFSAESVAELFAAYLNPKVAALIKTAAKGI